MRELLPAQPVDTVVIESWWRVQTGYIVDDDIKVANAKIDMLQLCRAYYANYCIIKSVFIFFCIDFHCRGIICT